MLISKNLNYVSGHLRYGHRELEVDEEKWNSMSDSEKDKFFDDNAEIIVDDYEIDDWEDSDEDYEVI